MIQTAVSELGKLTKNKYVAMAMQFVAAVGMKYAQNDLLTVSEGYIAVDSLSEYVEEAFDSVVMKEAVSLGIEQATDDIESPYLKAIADGMEGFVAGFAAKSFSSVDGFISIPETLKSYSKAIADNFDNIFDPSADAVRFYEFVGDTADAMVRSDIVVDQKAALDVEGATGDLKTSEEVGTQEYGSFDEFIAGQDTSSAQQLEQAFNMGRDTIAYKEMAALLENAASLQLDDMYTMGQNGLQMEAQVKVGDLAADWKNYIQDNYGLSKNAQVTLVYDMVNNETYVKWFSADKFNWGKDLNAKFNVKHLGQFIEGNIEHRVYRLANGKFDSVAIMTVTKAAFANDKVTTAVLTAAKVDKVKLELHSVGKSYMLIESSVNMKEFVSNLRDLGQMSLANKLSNSLSSKVLDLFKVSNFV